MNTKIKPTKTIKVRSVICVDTSHMIEEYSHVFELLIVEATVDGEKKCA